MNLILALVCILGLRINFNVQNGQIRPVLKHGPRSLVYMRVEMMINHEHEMKVNI